MIHTRPWAKAGIEPAISDILSDPLFLTIMASDGVTCAQMRALIEKTNWSVLMARRCDAEALRKISHVQLDGTGDTTETGACAAKGSRFLAGYFDRASHKMTLYRGRSIPAANDDSGILALR